VTAGEDVEVYDVEGSIRLPSPTLLRSLHQTRVQLNSGDYSADVRNNGQFIIHSVPAGSYILELVSIDYVFPLYKVDISVKVKNKISVSLHTPNSALNPGLPFTKTSYPLQISPISSANYFQLREGFSLSSLLKQPMALMMVFTLVMVVLMPRMMGNMNEKEKEEMARMQNSFSLTGVMKNLEKKVKETKQQT